VEVKAQFPAKLGFLFHPKRYKVARGGRGSGKSWSFARALLILGNQNKLRIGCFREVQKSIKDSVHKLLSDQIQALGLGQDYEVLTTEIRNKRTGTEILFSGLSDHTAESIKSFEGLDIAWIEEGQAVSARSWSILIPTLRKEDPVTGQPSEIWVSYNPDLETDETHQRFAIDPPPDCVSVLVNYNDNPWFPAVLEQERLECKRKYPKDYPNIWEGKCRPAADGAIYYDEMELVQERGQILNLPYDPKLKVHVVVDLGWNDAMSIILVQKNISEIRIIEYIEDTHRKLTDYSQELKEKKYNWGKLFIPHDGYNERVESPSAYRILKDLGWEIPDKSELVELNIENGIKATREVFPRCYFDKAKTARLIECLKRYRRNVPRNTNEPSTPMHDQYSHGADAFRYMALAIDQMTNETKSWKPIKYSNAGIV
jgi:phage terminase large subunit